MNEIVKTNRKLWIDLLRGIAIILVIFGHQGSVLKDFFVWTSPIKMPLFFAISGFLFTNKGSLYIGKLFMRLIFPYCILSLVPVVIVCHYFTGSNIYNEVLQFLFGWFIPTFFFSSILFRVLVVKLSNNKWLLFASFLIAAVGVIIPQNEILRVFEFKTILIAQHFMALGYAWKDLKKDDDSKPINRIVLIISIATYVILGSVNLIYYPLESIDVHTSSYYNPILCYIMILTGLYIMYVIGKYIGEKYENTIIVKTGALIGKHAIVIFLTQTIATIFLSFTLGSILPPNNRSYVTSLIYTICMVMISTIIGVICEKYCPIVLGISKKKK